MRRRISKTIWQSDQVEARQLCEGARDAWKAEGIKAVLCPAFNVRIPYHAELAALILPVWDDTYAPKEMYDMAVRFHRQFGPTLVHCNAGLNRSSAFAAALLVADGMDLTEALSTVNRVPWFPSLAASLKEWARGVQRT